MPATSRRRSPLRQRQVQQIAATLAAILRAGWHHDANLPAGVQGNPIALARLLNARGGWTTELEVTPGRWLRTTGITLDEPELALAVRHALRRSGLLAARRPADAA